MSKETPINDIQQTLSKEEDDIVNSILSDLNESQGEQAQPQVPPQQSEPQGPSPEQIQQMQQMQQIQQMQQMQQMQQAQQMQQVQQKEETKEEGFVQKLLNGDLKQPIIIAVIAFVFCLPQVNKVLLSTGISMFVGEDGSISMIGTAFKCLTIGILYYLFQTLQK